MYHELLRFKASCHKPVVACLLDVGCGGGYYLAAACDAIVGLPTGVVGGLGVLLNLYDIKGGMKLMPVDRPLDPLRGPGRYGQPGPRTLKDDGRGAPQGDGPRRTTNASTMSSARPGRWSSRDADFFDGRPLTGTEALRGRPARLGRLPRRRRPPRLPAEQDRGRPSAVMYRRAGDAARSLYASTPNRPIHPSTFPMSVPGVERSKMPLFLYMWQVEPGYARLNGI